MEIQPESLSITDRYKLLIGGIVPRPIALVSTVGLDGRPNLAPFSFFNGVGSNPMTVVFCPANDSKGAEKDTLRNCKPVAEGGTGQFVVNAAVESYAREVSVSAEPLAPGESEFDLSGLSPAPSVAVRAPRVAQSPLCFECETMQVVRTNPGAPSGGNIVVGRVVHVFVRDDVIDERHRIDPEKLRAIARMGGRTYARTRDRFDMPVGREALDVPPEAMD